MERMNETMQDILGYARTGVFPTAAPMQPSADPEASTVAGPSGGTQLWQPAQQPPESVSFASATPMMDQLPAPVGMPAMSSIDGTGLPSEEDLRELVELFFDLVHPWVPLFYKPDFIAGLFSPGRLILLHGVVVVAFRFWRKPTPPIEIREAYVKTSREQVLLKAIDACALVPTQALALLALDAVGQGPGPRTWNIMAMLITSVQQLGLAKAPSQVSAETDVSLVRNEDPDDGFALSNVEAEEKRRLFWVVYALDRYSSVSHGQSGGIDTKSIKLPYPSSEGDWGQAVTPDWFQAGSPVRARVRYPVNPWHYYIDMLALMDRSNRLLIQPVNLSLPAYCQEWQSGFRRLDIALSTWFENLPAEVREPPSSLDPMWIMVHATFLLYGLLSQ